MFSFENFELEYTPYWVMELPELEKVSDTSYRLIWPGHTSSDLFIPTEVLNEGSIVGVVENSYPLRYVQDHDLLQRPIPLSIAYHLAINPEFYFQDRTEDSFSPFHVGGLPPRYVIELINSRFALDDQYVTILNNIKSQFEENWVYEIGPQSGTEIFDSLRNLASAAHREYFHILSLYETNSSLHSEVWEKIARYFHWLGRVDENRVLELSGMTILPDVDGANFVRREPNLWRELLNYHQISDILWFHYSNDTVELSLAQERQNISNATTLTYYCPTCGWAGPDAIIRDGVYAQTTQCRSCEAFIGGIIHNRTGRQETPEIIRSTLSIPTGDDMLDIKLAGSKAEAQHSSSNDHLSVRGLP